MSRAMTDLIIADLHRCREFITFQWGEPRCQGKAGHRGVHWADHPDGRVLYWLDDFDGHGSRYQVATARPDVATAVGLSEEHSA